jgi:peptidoglycan/LPS O-acetylase OafA/YrhL
MTIGNWLTEQFEVSRGLGGKNVRPMEGLRGFAVFLVFLVHYVALIRPWIETAPALNSFATAIHTVGNTGVDLFFVLSGYLIYGSLIARGQRFLQFIRRRIHRIYPAFIAVFFLYIALSFLFPKENKIPSELPEAIIYLGQNFLLLPGIFRIEPMITVAWSLSYEIAYYLAIPMVIGVFRLRRHSAFFRVVVFILLGVVVLATCLTGGPVQLVLFIAGIVLYETVESFELRGPGTIVAITALLLGFLATLVAADGPVGFTIRTITLSLAFFLLCLTCFTRPTAPISRALSWTPVRWLGNMSYSYYLLHGLALKGYFLVLGVFLPVGGNEQGYFVLFLPIMFGLSMVPPAVLFLLIERPYSLVKPERKQVSGQRIDAEPAVSPAI